MFCIVTFQYIHILLILAGISISSLTGSGLFEKAKEARQKSKNSQLEEDGILADYENKIGQYVDGNRGSVTITKQEYEDLKNNMNSLTEEYEQLKSDMDLIKQESQQSKNEVALLKQEIQQSKNEVVLSQQEKVIGTWIDGKKLYSKAIQAVSKTVIYIRGWEVNGTAKAYVTLRYTKTTD